MVYLLNNNLKVILTIFAIVTITCADFITRAQWDAKAAKSNRKFTGTIPYVIIHHSYQPGVCTTTEDCKKAMQTMQKMHMNQRHWPDIGYSFAVGGDGNIYEGRGWNTVGTHAPGYNSRSVGLLLIGDFMDSLPSPTMISAAKNFIADGVAEGKISANYKLLGHRQTKATACPGNKLYEEIKTWPNWSANP